MSAVLDLGQEWRFWYMMRIKNHPNHHGNSTNNNINTPSEQQPIPAATSNYEHNIHPIATFYTIDQFWAIYGHLRRVHTFQSNVDYHLFREGIKPVWEDSANLRGGKWMVRLRKGLATRLWEHLILGLLGRSFEQDPDTLGQENGDVSAKPSSNAIVCGVVLSVRYQEDILSVWTSDSHDEEGKQRVKFVVQRILCLPPAMTIEYKAHDLSLRDRSSFRNTDKFKI